MSAYLYYKQKLYNAYEIIPLLQKENKKLEETIIQMKTNYSRWHQITEMEEEMYVNKVCEFMVEVIS